jgi:hypothetical protein
MGTAPIALPSETIGPNMDLMSQILTALTQPESRSVLDIENEIKKLPRSPTVSLSASKPGLLRAGL